MHLIDQIRPNSGQVIATRFLPGVAFGLVAFVALSFVFFVLFVDGSYRVCGGFVFSLALCLALRLIALALVSFSLLALRLALGVLDGSLVFVVYLRAAVSCLCLVVRVRHTSAALLN